MGHLLTLGKVDEFPNRRMRAFRIDGAEIVVVLVDGDFYAFSNLCTHRNEYLTDGFLIDSQIICGAHEATYELSTGSILFGPAFEPLPTYRVVLQEEAVQVDWPVAVAASSIVVVDLEGEDRSKHAFTI